MAIYNKKQLNKVVSDLIQSLVNSGYCIDSDNSNKYPSSNPFQTALFSNVDDSHCMYVLIVEKDLKDKFVLTRKLFLNDDEIMDDSITYYKVCDEVYTDDNDELSLLKRYLSEQQLFKQLRNYFNKYNYTEFKESDLLNEVIDCLDVLFNNKMILDIFIHELSIDLILTKYKLWHELSTAVKVNDLDILKEFVVDHDTDIKNHFYTIFNY